MSVIYRRAPIFKTLLTRIMGPGQSRCLSDNPENSTSNSTVTLDEYLRKGEHSVNVYSKHVNEVVSRWEMCNETYYGKERDFKNYPTIKQAPLHPKVRLGFIPDAWFQALYNKTGVTGPYLLLFGTTTCLLSKEILVADASFVEMLLYIGVFTIAVKKYGAMVAKYVDKNIDLKDQESYHRPMAAIREKVDRAIATADEEIGRCLAVANLVKAKEEFIDLQLEVVYRERIQRVYKTVYHYLKYHAERDTTQKRIQHRHLTDWVVNQVIKGITPSQEKETISHCISDLRRLVQAHKAAATA